MRILALLATIVGLASTAEWDYTGHGEDMWKDDFATCGGQRQSPIDIPASDSAHLEYQDLGEDMWKDDFATCGGQRQSPIDIPASDSAHLEYQDLGQVSFNGYNSMLGNLELSNNGHTATVSIDNTNEATFIQGGGLVGKYLALQFHFHWGRNPTTGSEHTFRGQAFPLELHIVHWKASYGDVGTALTNGDGAAVIGVFFELSNEDNDKLNPIIDSLADIKFKGQSNTIQLSLDDILGSETSEFYRYEGSLTTPGCNEAVIWTVLEGRNTISARQLAKFGMLRESDISSVPVPMEINYRAVQPINDRVVTKNFDGDVPPSYHWGYGQTKEGPGGWPQYYPTCSGHRQSPVNIPALYEKRIADFDASLGLDTLEFVNYDKIVTGDISNNGHSVVVSIDSPDVYIHKGGLPGKYKAVQFHYHWGVDNMHGSEHTINGHMFPLEMHIVHYKTSYGSVAEALKRDDGLAVIGFLFKESDTANAHYNGILNKMNDVKFKGQKESISGFTLQQLSLDNLRANASSGVHYPFYRYEGGLTTPPCSQVVIWTVINEPVYISSAQLEKFRELTHITETSAPLTDHDKILENFRPVQDLKYRHIFLSRNGMVGESGMSMPVGFKWGYHGGERAENWHYYYPTCSGERQSPINIPSFVSDELVFDPSMGLDSLEFVNYNMDVTGTIKNNGHTVQVDIDSPAMYIQKGGLGGKYKALQFHFHWGPDNKHGSEHTLNGQAYPLELHIVHWKESYGTVTEALKHRDGLAVVGFFFEASSYENENYAGIISSLMDVKYKGAAKAISGFSLQDIALPRLRQSPDAGDHHAFYRYEGGLTTPPCSQIVTWTVMHSPIRVSAAQIAEFRKLLHVTEPDHMAGHSEAITENYRPVQELHTRLVYTSYGGFKVSSSASGTIASVLCIALAAVFVALLR